MNQSFSVRALRGSAWAIFSALFPNLIAMVVFVVTSRILSPSDFGAVAIATSISLLVAALIPAGYGEALVQRQDMQPAHAQTVFTACLFSGIVFYIGLFLARDELAALFSLPSLAIILPVMAVRVIFDAIAVVPNALIARSMSFHLLAARTVTATLLSSLVAIALVYTGFGLWALVASQVAGSIAIAVASLWASGWRPNFRYSHQAFRELTGYGLYSSGTKTLQTVIAQSDSAIIGFFLGPAQVGLYNFARRIYSILNENLSGALNTVAHPTFSGIQSDKERVRRGFALATFLSSAVSFPMFIGLAVVCDRLIPMLFGEKWMDATLLVRIFCIHGLISCIGLLQAGLIRSQGRARWWFYYSLANGISSIIIIATCAQFGAAIMLGVNVIKSYLLWPTSVIVTLKILEWNAPAYLRGFAGPALASAGMVACIEGLRLLVAFEDPLFALAGDIGVGVIAYAALLCLLSRSRVVQIAQLLRGAIRPNKPA